MDGYIISVYLSSNTLTHSHSNLTTISHLKHRMTGRYCHKLKHKPQKREKKPGTTINSNTNQKKQGNEVAYGRLSFILVQ